MRTRCRGCRTTTQVNKKYLCKRCAAEASKGMKYAFQVKRIATITCRYCNKTWTEEEFAKAHNLKTRYVPYWNRRKFCNQSCKHKYAATHLRKTNLVTNNLQKECLACGKIMYQQNTQTTRAFGVQKYCCEACRRAHSIVRNLAEIYTGKLQKKAFVKKFIQNLRDEGYFETPMAKRYRAEKQGWKETNK